jgi:four helix bundle protein
MAYIQSYRELNVWQKADELAVRVYAITSKFPREYLYDLTSQLRRAALSIPTNLAEGCASPHTGELLQFINIAKRFLSETQYLLEFAHKIGLINAADVSV